VSVNPKHLIEHYAIVGTIAGGSSAVFRAISDGNSPLFWLVVGALSGALCGGGYGYLKLRRAARSSN
jgi:hypothetical protein